MCKRIPMFLKRNSSELPCHLLVTEIIPFFGDKIVRGANSSKLRQVWTNYAPYRRMRPNILPKLNKLRRQSQWEWDLDFAWHWARSCFAFHNFPFSDWARFFTICLINKARATIASAQSAVEKDTLCQPTGIRGNPRRCPRSVKKCLRLENARDFWEELGYSSLPDCTLTEIRALSYVDIDFEWKS